MGRPPKSASPLSKQEVLTEALRQVDMSGRNAVTFKSLADALKITPMAVAHHVGTRQNMFALMINRVFENVSFHSDAAKPTDRLYSRLQKYCQRVVLHPELTHAVLENPQLISDCFEELTQALRGDLHLADIPDTEIETVLGILVDYTHGFAFSLAAAPDQGLTVDHFGQGLSWILCRLE